MFVCDENKLPNGPPTFFSLSENITLPFVDLQACVEQLRVSSSAQHAIVIRRCIRNLARNPVFRLRCSGAVPLLASSLEDEVQGDAKLEIAAASAAAACIAVRTHRQRPGRIPRSRAGGRRTGWSRRASRNAAFLR